MISIKKDLLVFLRIVFHKSPDQLLVLRKTPVFSNTNLVPLPNTASRACGCRGYNRQGPFTPRPALSCVWFTTTYRISTNIQACERFDPKFPTSGAFGSILQIIGAFLQVQRERLKMLLALFGRQQQLWGRHQNFWTSRSYV